jgi:hypothetical protein
MINAEGPVYFRSLFDRENRDRSRKNLSKADVVKLRSLRIAKYTEMQIYTLPWVKIYRVQVQKMRAVIGKKQKIKLLDSTFQILALLHNGSKFIVYKVRRE